MKTRIFPLVLLASLVLSLGGWAQQSPNYQLKAHALNSGGDPKDGAALTSTNYKCIVSSIGDGLAATGMTSPSYKADSGFPTTTVVHSVLPCTLACTATVPATGTAGSSVAFASTATPSNCAGTPTFDWNFGDGTVHSTSQNPSHIYASAGSYNWALTVTDAGQTCSKSVTIAISAPSSLTASASASPLSGQSPLPVSFQGSATGGTAPYTYSWILGDGATSTLQNPSHTYAQAGLFTAVLTVTDSASHTAQASGVTIQVIAPLTATASSDRTSGTAPLAVAFAGSASGGTAPYSYDWDFGDGTAHSSTQNPNHTYGSVGDFTVTLTAADSASHTATDSHLVIHVTAPPPPPPVVALIKKISPPFTIVVTGSNLQNGIKVYIGIPQWVSVLWKNTGKIKLTGGTALKLAVPKGTTQTFRFVNPDGGEVTQTWGW